MAFKLFLEAWIKKATSRYRSVSDIGNIFTGFYETILQSFIFIIDLENHICFARMYNVIW